MIQGGALGHMVSINLEAESKHVSNQYNQLCLIMEPSKNSGIKVHLSLILCLLSHTDAGWIIHPESMGEDNRSSVFGTLPDSTLCVSPLADFNLYPFLVKNHNCEYKAFIQ